MRRFEEGEVRAVLAHEIGHVANGDMITLTLIQGVVNTFVMFFARIIGHTVDRVIFKTERGYGNRLLCRHCPRPDRTRHTRQHDCHVVLSPPRVSR